MNKELEKIIQEAFEEVSKNGLPVGGEKKYLKQEPGGTMSAVNIEEILDELSSIDEESFRVYNETLCPDLWDSSLQLDPDVKAGLLKVAQDFYEKTELKAPVIDIYLMGSIANYNWTPDSDVDIHVMIDFDALQMPPETAKEVVKTAGSLWNDEHEVTVKGHKVEINIQNIKEEKPHVTGIYSLTKSIWIRKPSFENVTVNKMAVQTKYKAMKRYLDAVISSGDRELMKQAKKYVDAFRQYGLDTVGELSVENIVFKILRSKGILKNLKECILSLYDKEMSVKEGSGTTGNTIEKDVKSTYPSNPVVNHRINWDKLTIDGLNALREKSRRFVSYYKNKIKNGLTRDEVDELNKNVRFYQRIDAEIKERLKALNEPTAIGNPNIDEGYGAGIPETDRLKIKNVDGSTRRWQIRSKNAPKTPSLSEDMMTGDLDQQHGENPLAAFIKQLQQGTRIDLFPEDQIPLEYTTALQMADKALMKRSNKGEKTFTLEFVEELLDDVLACEIPQLQAKSEMHYMIKMELISHLVKDYDIRTNSGNRIK